jgi:hypothetical protein
MRRTFNDEDRALREEIERSTKVSSYLDGVYEAVTTGNMNAAKSNVPNYGTGQNSGFVAHEVGGLSMDMDGLFASSAEAIGEAGMEQAMANAFPAREGQPTFSGQTKTAQRQSQPRAGTCVTENQYRAIKKYPQIVEFLGTEKGTKIANRVLSEINTLIAEQIAKNTQLVHDHAVDCVAQKQYLHQFFKGEDWVCKVTASGPFRGSEAFYFKEDEDKSFILRRTGDRYVDVSSEFNIIHDYRTVESEGGNHEE